MDIIYRKQNDELKHIVERVQGMSLAYLLVADEHADQIVIADGSAKYTGIDEIHKYLDQLSEELHQWYYCNC